MQGFEPYLHWSFHNEHVLFPAIRLDSFGGFSLASLIVALICLSERALAFILDEQWSPKSFRLSRIRIALWRTGLYALATSFRLFYMLVAMTFHAGLFVVIVVTLSAAQLAIEMYRLPQPRSNGFSQLRNSSDSQTGRSIHSLETSSLKSKHRPRSKPKEIFIHPAQSNIARADAVALELGLGGETERVKAPGLYQHPNVSSPAWGMGKGRDKARELLAGDQNHRTSNSLGHEEEEDHLFINDSESESDS